MRIDRLRNIGGIAGRVRNTIKNYLELNGMPNVVVVFTIPEAGDGPMYFVTNVPAEQAQKALRDVAAKIGERIANDGAAE